MLIIVKGFVGGYTGCTLFAIIQRHFGFTLLNIVIILNMLVIGSVKGELCLPRPRRPLLVPSQLQVFRWQVQGETV